MRPFVRVLSLTFIAAYSLAAESFVMPLSGTLYIEVIRDDGAEWTFGVGTSEQDYREVVRNTPSLPSGEVVLGAFAAGETVHFGMWTRFGNVAAWAFSNRNDDPSRVVFQDSQNRLGLGGNVIEQTSIRSWTLHLDNAASYLYDDDNNDVVIRMRLAPNSNGETSELSGRYFFSNFVAVSGPPVAFASAFGQAEFAGNGRLTYTEQTNGAGLLSALSGTGAHTPVRASAFDIQIGTDPRISVYASTDGTTLIGTSVNFSDPAVHNYYFAVRAPQMPASNGSLSGTYWLYQFIASELGGPTYASAFGTVTFDGNGGYSSEQRVNDGESIQQRSVSGTYRVEADGTAFVEGGGLEVVGGVSDGGDTLIGNVLSVPGGHNFYIAVRKADGALSESDLHGHYGFIEFNRFPGDVFASGIGTSYVDGAGTYTSDESVNIGGERNSVSGSGQYTVSPNGVVSLRAESGEGFFEGGVFGPTSDFIGSLSVAGSNNAQQSLAGAHGFTFGIRLKPWLTQTGVTNGAGFGQPPLAPGSIATLFGRYFGSPSGMAGSLQGGQLGRSIAGLQVTVGGVPAPLFFANRDQVNVQIPFELGSAEDPEIVVSLNDVSSAPVRVMLATGAPGVFETGGTAIAVDGDGMLVTPTAPARSGEVIVVFVTGLGQTAPPLGTGVVPTASASASSEIEVTIGGVAARVLYAGVTPGFVGLYQLNVEVPGDTPTGPQELAVSAAGRVSNRTFLPTGQ